MDQNKQTNYKLEYFEVAMKEYQNLDGSQRVFVDKGLKRIAVLGMHAGTPLHGALEGCNKLKNKKMGLRIVFKQKNNQIRIIQIVAIGQRRRNKVYNDSLLRLKK